MGLLSTIKKTFCNILGIETKQKKAERLESEEKKFGTSQPVEKPATEEEKEKKEKVFRDPNEDFKYVCESGKVMCKYCSNPIGDIVVTSNTIALQDKPWVTIGDCNGKVNLVFKGVCNHPSHGSKKPPCSAVIQLDKWTDFSDTMIDNDNALMVKSKIKCLISG